MSAKKAETLRETEVAKDVEKEMNKSVGTEDSGAAENTEASKGEETSGNGKENKDPDMDLVDFMVPISDRDTDDVLIIVNGKGWRIQRGQSVKIPRYVYNAYVLSERQKLDRLKFEQKLEKEAYMGDM